MGDGQMNRMRGAYMSIYMGKWLKGVMVLWKQGRSQKEFRGFEFRGFH